MKRPLKYTFLSALVIIGILYWTLAIISEWLLEDDSKAVEKFTQQHLVVTSLPAIIWAADAIGGRYIVTLILLVTAGWVSKQKVPEPDS